MKYFPTIARILLGLVFLVFGLNGFLNFFPPPPTGIPQGAMDFSIAMMKTGYFTQLVSSTEILAGVLLLTNLFVPLALLVLAPVILNIVAFHVFLMPSGLPIPIVVVLLELYLAWTYRRVFGPVVAMHPSRT